MGQGFFEEWCYEICLAATGLLLGGIVVYNWPQKNIQNLADEIANE